MPLPPGSQAPLPTGLPVAVVGLTLGEVSSSSFRIWLMNSRCCFSSSSWATACSLRCSFCCVPASSSRSHWFSCTRRRTCARSFCFSDSTAPRWLDSARITCGGQRDAGQSPVHPQPGSPGVLGPSEGLGLALPMRSCRAEGLEVLLSSREFSPKAPNRP